MLTKLRSGEAKTLELKGYERRIYLHAAQLLKQWNPDVPLDSAILDYSNAMKRVGERDISLADIVKDFANRNQSTFESRMLPDVIGVYCREDQKGVQRGLCFNPMPAP